MHALPTLLADFPADNLLRPPLFSASIDSGENRKAGHDGDRYRRCNPIYALQALRLARLPP